MFERRSVLLFIGTLILLLITILSLIGLATTDMTDTLVAQGLEVGTEEYELTLSVTKGMLFFGITSMILSTILYGCAFIYRKPGLALVGAIICTVSIITAPIYLAPTAICGYMGFSKQKKINQEYELLNSEEATLI